MVVHRDVVELVEGDGVRNGRPSRVAVYRCEDTVTEVLPARERGLDLRGIGRDDAVAEAGTFRFVERDDGEAADLGKIVSTVCAVLSA